MWNAQPFDAGRAAQAQVRIDQVALSIDHYTPADSTG